MRSRTSPPADAMIHTLTPRAGIPWFLEWIQSPMVSLISGSIWEQFGSIVDHHFGYSQNHPMNNKQTDQPAPETS